MTGYLFAFFALIPGFAVVQLVRTSLFVCKMLRTGIPAQGVIISQRQVERSRGHETYLVPQVRFQTLQGQLIEGESWRQDGDVEFFDGDEAYLRYDPGQPTDFLFVQQLLPPPYWLLALHLLLLAVAVGIVGQTALGIT